MYPFKQDDLSQLIYIRLVKCEITFLGIIHVPISVSWRLKKILEDEIYYGNYIVS